MTQDLLFAVLIGAGTLALLLGAIYILQRFLIRKPAEIGRGGAAPAPHGPTALRGQALASLSGNAQARTSASTAEPAATVEKAAEIELEFYRYAFGAPHLSYPIRGEHQDVVQEAVAAIREAIHQQEYFPRRPLLIPQLLRAMHDDDTSRQKLAEIVLQDPVLSGDVLKLVNSSFYRTSAAPIENIERAIVVLGIQGLKSVVASTLLQPVFQRHKGLFENFSPVIWNYALFAGNAAAEQAVRTGSCDHFSAHLLGLLSALGPLVLFRLTFDIYQRHSGVPPQAATFIHVIQTHGALTNRLIGESWELSEPFIQGLEEQNDPAPVTPFGQVLRHGRLTAMTTLLNAQPPLVE